VTRRWVGISQAQRMNRFPGGGFTYRSIGGNVMFDATKGGPD
jgi:hypothetical protein